MAFGVGLALGVFSIAALAPRVPFLPPTTPGPWISFPTQPNPLPVSVRSLATIDTFTRAFNLASVPKKATLRIATFGQANVSLNGSLFEIQSRGGEIEKQAPTLQVAPFLRSGRNELRIDIRNRYGPSLLSLCLDAPPLHLVSDSAWRAARDSAAYSATVATDTLPWPEAGIPSPATEMLGRWPLLLIVLAGCAIVFGARRALPETRLRSAPDVALWAVTTFWCLLYVIKIVHLPPHYGFDATAHRDYIEYLLANHRVPMADEGWSMFHPPLYYLSTAALVAISGQSRGSILYEPLIHLPSFLSGILIIWLSWRLVRELSDDVRAQTIAVLAAGLAPMNIYVASYPSNEVPSAAMLGLAILIAVGLVLSRRTTHGDMFRLGAALGLSLLTKATSLLLVPILVLGVAAKLLLVERAAARRYVLLGCTLLVTTASLCGWYYWRNIVHFGKPVVTNWDVDSAALPGWWQYPGFHTAAYFLQFGEALTRPFFSGVRSFWDGLYSTLWGDGYCGGRTAFKYATRLWNYQFMSIGYLLAIPATLLTLVGFGRSVRECFEPDLRRRIAILTMLASCVVLAVAIVMLNLRYPFFSHAKAFFALPLLPIAAFMAGNGFALVDDMCIRHRLVPARVALYASMAMLAVVIGMTYLA